MQSARIAGETALTEGKSNGPAKYKYGPLASADDCLSLSKQERKAQVVSRSPILCIKTCSEERLVARAYRPAHGIACRHNVE